MLTTWILLAIVTFGVVTYCRTSLVVSSAIFAALFLVLSVTTSAPAWLVTTSWVMYAAIVGLLAIVPLRTTLISQRLFKLFKKQMPSMSQTEAEALAAGTVGFEGEIFSGKPNWENLFNHGTPTLSSEEQAFLEGPVATVCRMVDDWDITFKRRDLPPEIWQYLQEQRFFGLIIPKEYGGREFSAYAHSEIIVKLSSRCVTLATTVSVPNSLGPAELLLHYGTDEQKEYYLPRLARGEEIPCFALTGPTAGSDAASMPDIGVVCQGEYQGKQVLGVRLNFEKRYITLAPVATLVGLAFKLEDPEHLLSEQTERGITCALIPANTPGIQIGRRHFALDTPFQNGPIFGKDVFIPLDFIIGGENNIGKGWRMLMECLAAGRAISLPSTAVGGIKAGVLACSAYASLRRQFNVPIAAFEGIAEVLARVAGNAYITNAMRCFATGAIDNGAKPSVLSAIAKYHVTERGRECVNDAMDIHGGKGICLGPRNYLGRAYECAPISITVEGANILTRCLIIFGQGAMRSHPYLLNLLNAATIENKQKALQEFDQCLFQYAGFITSNIVRSVYLGLTGARLVKAPRPQHKRIYQRITRYSSILALLTDVSALTLGAKLKRKEALSARLGDVLSLLVLTSSMLKYHQEQDNAPLETPLLTFCCENLLAECEQQIKSILQNLPNRMIARTLKVLCFPFGFRAQPASVKQALRLTKQLTTEQSLRQTLGQGSYITDDGKSPIGHLEKVFAQALRLEPIRHKVEKAIRQGQVKGDDYQQQLAHATQLQLITEQQQFELADLHDNVLDIIQVDHFAPEELSSTSAVNNSQTTLATQ